VAIEKKDYDPKPYEKLNDEKNIKKVREDLEEMKVRQAPGRTCCPA